MFTHAICVMLAPAMAYAAAFPWALPEPTIYIPAADSWSPAPTPAPQLLGFGLPKRQALERDNTCGFVSGSSESSITCHNTDFICATNTQYGVHGCCDPQAMSSCTIPTTCIARTAMSTACTDAFCSSNSAIVKCTESAMPECYKWIFVYSKTTMIEHGCVDKGFNSSVSRYWGQASTIPPELYRTVTTVVTASSTPTLSASSKSSKPNIGVIVGGTIGGCTVISIIILAIFLIYRRRKNARDSITQPPITRYHDGNGTVTEYNPHGFPTPLAENDNKLWQQQNQGPVSRADDSMPQYPGMGSGRYGIVEVDGMQRPVEAPAEITYHAREYMRT
jgi:hypothetical protein